MHRFCIMLQAIGSSHEQVIFMPPLHFSIFMVQRGTMSMFGIIGEAVVPIGDDAMPGMPMPGIPMPVRSIIIVFVIDPYSLRCTRAGLARPSGVPRQLSEGDYTSSRSDCNDFIAFRADLSARSPAGDAAPPWYTFRIAPRPSRTAVP
jgi:hypothetical protein